MRTEDNIVYLTDSYKTTHWNLYPPKTTKVYSYFESRGSSGVFSEFGKDSVTFFGLSYIIQRYLSGKVVTHAKIDEAKELLKAHFGRDLMYETGWRKIVDKHGGMLPILIHAIPEGTTVDTKNVLMTVENTDPDMWWLTNYVESLLVQIWYPCTVATLSRKAKEVIENHLIRTCGSTEGIEFKLHDFGFRGASSVETSAIGGAAHLVNFLGTDTLPALALARDYYGADCAGFSIPATEHSVMAMWERDGELDVCKHILEKHPDGLVAAVSDTYNIFEACNKIWGKDLKQMVLDRDGTLVIRPDSGPPAATTLQVLRILEDQFGSTKNKLGFKELPSQVRLIWGDGVDLETIHAMLIQMRYAGWAASNIAFGMGGALLQKVHRDNLNFAFKASYGEVAGEGREVYKDPITDPGKTSKKGRLKLVKWKEVNDTKINWNTIPEMRAGRDEMVRRFSNGIEYNNSIWDEVVKRAEG